MLLFAQATKKASIHIRTNAIFYQFWLPEIKQEWDKIPAPMRRNNPLLAFLPESLNMKD